MKCLDCAINTLIHTFSGGASISSRLSPLVCVKWRAFLKQDLILKKFNLPGNLKGRLRAVPLRSVTSKLGRTGESELTERGTGDRREEEGLTSLL